jgi:hypothetical protein
VFLRSDEVWKQLYVTVVMLEQTERGLRLKLGADPLIGISAADRAAFSDPNGKFAAKGLWRWAAGGTLIVYQQAGQKFLALALRNPKAPSFGGHLTLTSGLSSSFEEFFNPTSLAIREGTEETAVVVDNQLAVLSLGPAFEEVAWSVFEKQLTRARKFKWVKVGEAPFYVEAEFIETEEQKIEIVHGERISRHQGIICLDPKTRGIDLLKIIQVNLPARSEVIFFDCEDTKTGPLDLEIVVFPLERIKTLKEEGAVLKIRGASKSFKSSKGAPANPRHYYPCTPVLEKALKAILPG